MNTKCVTLHWTPYSEILYLRWWAKIKARDLISDKPSADFHYKDTSSAREEQAQLLQEFRLNPENNLDFIHLQMSCIYYFLTKFLKIIFVKCQYQLIILLLSF